MYLHGCAPALGKVSSIVCVTDNISKMLEKITGNLLFKTECKILKYNIICLKRGLSTNEIYILYQK